MEVLSIGSPAPAFCLPDKDNTEICLNAFAGKWVILYFYPRDNTPGCTTEAKGFNEELTAFSHLNAEIIGISADSCTSHAKFAGTHGLKIILLSDESHRVIEEYHAWQPKRILGREIPGIVRTTYIIGPDATIREVWPRVRVTGHVKAVKERLEELQEISG
ncbi:peroxiredoxin [Methanogenium organophilum]|uniref:thioredoxin-dependent peroxiredoxin n=1 Tax=Methanogenium organophilum TaxID=2199 RepID=A0A9X9S2R2_METOG|nr:peroxiredoxin [Methanogenium organophilum]WAI00433.1 peroxiredoxin [Methanogenium organophilum]